ncbi:MAG: non-hydrolyzing UDP-N-acetylglucosamine 2-epimerase, partial [Hyphomicrobium sp.]
MSFTMMSIVGARPQFVKAAAISRAVARSRGLTEQIVHTGQHFDDNMSAVFFRELNIPEPAFRLDIHGGGHGAMTGRMLEAIEGVLVAEKPDLVLIYGDTNSTLAGALAAAKLHIPVAHVEAGLRSFNRRMPEEVNRVVADHLSALLFCPTHDSVRNLANEGVTAGVHHVGDVMYDATLFARRMALEHSRILDELAVKPNGYAVCTMHRAENTDDPDRLKRLVAFLEQKAANQEIVFPVHPRTRGALERLGLTIKGLKLVAPLG